MLLLCGLIAFLFSKPVMIYGVQGGMQRKRLLACVIGLLLFAGGLLMILVGAFTTVAEALA